MTRRIKIGHSTDEYLRGGQSRSPNEIESCGIATAIMVGFFVLVILVGLFVMGMDASSHGPRHFMLGSFSCLKAVFLVF
jgi:hypothetical protein